MSMSEPEMHAAWRPWQPADLLAEYDDFSTEIDAVVTSAAPAEEQLQLELKRRREQAEKQGFAQGHARGIEEGKQQGYLAGVAQGRQEGAEQALAEARAQHQQQADRLARLIDEFQEALTQLNSVVPARLVQLSLTAARAIVGKSVRCDPAQLLENIQQLLKQETLLNGQLQLRVSASQLATVQHACGALLASRGWTLLADDAIAPGGCRITSDEGELDATLESRWQALCDLSREESGA